MEATFLKMQTLKRKRIEQDELMEEEFYRPYRRRKLLDEDDDDYLFAGAVKNCLLSLKKDRKTRSPVKERKQPWWDKKYRESTPESFKKSMRIENLN